ncbi:MAG TPA: phosphotransferase [Ktedonobacterales bacterium]
MDDNALTAAALAVFRASNPGEAVAQVETITRGWDSLALLVNAHWLLRVARRPEVDASLRLEARLLPVIATAVAPIQVPRFTLARLDDEPAVAGYAVIRGQSLTSATLAGASEARVAALAGQIAAFLTALHSIPAARVAGASVPLASVADWRAEYAEFRAWARVAAAPLLAPRLRVGLERLWSNYLDSPGSFAFAPALVHRDLAPEHVLLAADGALAGVIDWGDAAYGDPAIDFAGFLHDLGEPFARQVIAGWRGARAAGETADTLLARARFYARLAPLHGVRFGLLTGQEAYVRQGVTDLTRALADPDPSDTSGAPA